MSAECSKCGTDIVYPVGTWPVGECPVCTPRIVWVKVVDGEYTSLIPGFVNDDNVWEAAA